MKSLLRIIIKYYLKFLTKVILWRNKPLIVAIAGTTNKTFIKKIILKEFSKETNVRGNPKSFDTEIGLPLAVLFLPSGYSSVFRWADVLLTGTQISFFSRNFPKILVLEMTAERKGDMKYLLSMIKPKITILTNINQNFPDVSLEGFNKEIKKLADSIPQDGLIISNGDDYRLEKITSKNNAKIIKFGYSSKCQARITNSKKEEMGQSFDLNFENKKEKIKLDNYGKHNVYALVAARVAVGEMRRKLKYFKKNG
jgi:UDP-N-acetylmuramoyl-tripeptide--D-alanyl-D-alanine ligase